MPVWLLLFSPHYRFTCWYMGPQLRHICVPERSTARLCDRAEGSAFHKQSGYEFGAGFPAGRCTSTMENCLTAFESWMTQGARTPVQLQRQCGSCWISSMTCSHGDAWTLNTGSCVVERASMSFMSVLHFGRRAISGADAQESDS